MAITTDALIDFFGNTDQVISVAGAAVTDTNFSDGGDLTQWTNDDDAREAMATLDATLSGNPDTGSTIGLYARLDDISDTTQAANVPDSDFPHLLLGLFPMDDQTTLHVVSIPIELPNQYTSQKYDFYLGNHSGVSINTGSTVDITPKAPGPHG